MNLRCGEWCGRDSSSVIWMTFLLNNGFSFFSFDCLNQAFVLYKLAKFSLTPYSFFKFLTNVR